MTISNKLFRHIEMKSPKVVVNNIWAFWAVSFSLFLLFTAFSPYFKREDIDFQFLVIELFCGVVLFCGIYTSIRIKNIIQLLLLIFMFSFLTPLAIRNFFENYYARPYGLAIDSYTYDSIVIPCLNENLSKLNQYIFGIGGFDDLGYPYILYFIYKVSGSVEFGRILVIIVNAIVLTLSSALMYKLTIQLNFSKRIAIVLASLYGFNPFFYVTSAVGLKEVIFCFFILGSLFYMYEWKAKKNILSFLLTIILITFTSLFRSAVCLMLILTFIFLIILNKNNRKKILWIAIIVGGLSPVFADLVLQKVIGVSLEHILAVTTARNGLINSEVSGPIIQIIASLFGPFPNFFRIAEYGILFSSGILLKSLMNVFFLIGGAKVIYQYDYTFYPLLLYALFGLSLLIVGGVALDMRYTITFYVPFLIISFVGMGTSKARHFFYAYLPFIIILIFYYNVR